ncbi:MAG: hypothetical protein ACU826_11515 [Gammaproteobacteria bacterium]
MNTRVLIEHQLARHRLLGIEVCREMSRAIRKLGFPEEECIETPDFASAEFSLIKDPYTADENLNGIWYDKNHRRIGNIQFLSDGSFYAEYDIVKPHPTRSQWFVEGVNAWGRGGHIKTEAKLLPTVQ